MPIDDGFLIAWRFTCGLSVIGSSLVCFLFFYSRWWNNSTHHIILFCISVADIIYSVTLCVGPSVPGSSIWCTVHGVFVMTFAAASQLWCAALGLNLWLQMRYFWKDIRCRKMIPWYCAFIWGGCPISATIIGCVGTMQQDGFGCWISMEKNFWFVMCTVYFPMWSLFGFYWFIIAKMVLLLRRIIASIPEDCSDSSVTKRHFKFVTGQTILFIFAGIFCWGAWCTSFKWENVPLKWIAPLYIINSLQGFVNVLVYVLPPYLLRYFSNDGKSEERSIDTTKISEKDVEIVEMVVKKQKKVESDVEFKEFEEFTTSVMNLLLTSSRMTFFEGPGKDAIDIVRRGLFLEPTISMIKPQEGEGQRMPK